MRHVDALSRVQNILVLEENNLEQNLALHQYQDETIKKIMSALEEGESPYFELRNGLVYRKAGDKILFYVPEKLRDNIVRIYHDQIGHFGVDKTTS